MPELPLPGRATPPAKFGLAPRYFRNSFALYPFADPHTLNHTPQSFTKKWEGGPLRRSDSTLALTPLAATFMDTAATVANKGLTV